MNIITKTQLSIDNKMEEIIMNKCALKYIAEKDDTTTKRCVVRLITQKWLFGKLIIYRLLYFFYNVLTIHFF